jgi:hypothetical protein
MSKWNLLKDNLVKLKVKVLKDTVYKHRKIRAGQEIAFEEEDAYIDWYFETGKNVPHDVREETKT